MTKGNIETPRASKTQPLVKENTVKEAKRLRVSRGTAASAPAPDDVSAEEITTVAAAQPAQLKKRLGRPKGSKNKVAASVAAPSLPTEHRELTIPVSSPNSAVLSADGNISFVARPSLSKQAMPIRYLKGISETGMINLNPPYQRPAGAWTGARRRALIYSLIAGIDVPKLYFRSSVDEDSRTIMEVVDGKQRITTIFDFINGAFRTGSDAMFATPEIANKKFNKLPTDIQERILNYAMDVVVLKDYDEALISQMFLLLQQGVSTTAQENRNAHLGVIRDTVVDIANHEVFGYVSFTNARLGYQQISSQVLAMALNDGNPTNISKTGLDAMYSRYGAPEYTQMVDAASENTLKVFSYIQNGILALLSDEQEQIEEATVGEAESEPLVSRRALSKGGFITLCAYLFKTMQSFDIDANAPEVLDMFFTAYDNIMDKADNDFTAYKSYTGGGSDSAEAINSRVDIIYRRTLELMTEDFAKEETNLFNVSSFKTTTDAKEPELVN